MPVSMWPEGWHPGSPDFDSYQVMPNKTTPSEAAQMQSEKFDSPYGVQDDAMLAGGSLAAVL